MKNTVNKYISDLLFVHDCVILPGFGGFVANEKSAELNTLTGTLTPPTKEILFNINLKTNDGLLITHIASQENISHKLAKEKLLDYVDSINEKLNATKLLRIEKIGLFTKGLEGNITFIQDKTTNYNLLSYGLSTTYNKKIIRSTITENKIKSKIVPITNYSIKPKKLLKAAAIIIPLITLSYLSISQQNNINNVYNQMASLNLFSSNNNIEKITQAEAKNNITISISSELFEKNIKKENIAEKENVESKVKETYHIIGGVFSEEKNAKRMLAKLSRWNYDAKIIRDNNLMRVSYESYEDKDNALLALYRIKQANPNAWLLTN